MMFEGNLKERNKAVLAERQPHLKPYLDIPVSSDVKVVRREGAVIDVILGDRAMYDGDCWTWSQTQLDEYFDAPDRLFAGSPALCNLSRATVPANAAAVQWMSLYMTERARWPDRGVGHFFGIGLGLGAWLPGVLERRPAKHVTVVENVSDFLILSLEAVDWEAIFALADGAGIRLRIYIAENPAAAMQKLYSVIRTVGSTFMDGSYSFGHYYSWFTREVKEKVAQGVANHYLTSGFFEDEVIMMSNTYRNLAQFDCRLLTARLRVALETPAFIVGSGPSVGNAIPTIRRCREKAVVISAGTALGVLLKNGIRPDIHVEHENVPAAAEAVARTHQMWGPFDGITLIASTTVRPALAELFPQRIFYWRPGLSSSALLRRTEDGVLSSPGPMAANAAFSAAVHLGFTEFYFMGVDCGQRPGGDHHSKDSLYFDPNMEALSGQDQHKKLASGMTRKVPANFGGEAMTSWSLDLSRSAFRELIHKTNVTVHNCSDGAVIEGAAPRAPQSVHLEDVGSSSGTERLAQAFGRLPTYSAGQLLQAVDLATLRQGCNLLPDELETFIKEHLGEDSDEWAGWDTLVKLMQEKEIQGPARIISSALMSMFRLSLVYGNRLTADERKSFFRFFAPIFKDRANIMNERISALFERMESGEDFEPEEFLEVPPIPNELLAKA